VTVEDDWGDHANPRQACAHFRLDRAVAGLYEDLRLTPMLHKLLSSSRQLLDGVAGSISVVDPRSGSYSKLAERGITCRLGQRFSLEEGATGRAFAERRPVVIDDYSALTGGHLPPGHAASRGSATAVPIWWRGDVIGVNVTFAGRQRRFSAAEIDRLEVLTQSAAGALITAGAGDPSVSRLLRERVDTGDDRPALTVVREVGTVGPVPPDVARAAVDLVRSVHADAAQASPEPAVRALKPSPLTAREAEVLALVAQGLGDRDIARALVVSPRTVEKHVGAALRKTGSSSRTGAAVRAVERGWVALPPGAA
jgi:DNA-binding CsgD family transcriptional regulator